MKVKPNWGNIRALGLKSHGARVAVDNETVRIANLAAGRVGFDVVRGDTGDKDSGRMRIEDDDTPTRVRSAIIAHHPDPKPRQSGREALRASM
jgi:hypothetical protein